MAKSVSSNNSANAAPVTTGVKDEMSIGSQESIAPRWISPETKKKTGISALHWTGILRDDTMVAEYSSEDNNKLLQMSRRFLKKPSTPSAANAKKANLPFRNNVNSMPSSPPIVGASNDTEGQDVPKVDWEFKTYAVQSQRRMVHAVKFFVYEKLPLKPGARAKLHNLQQQSFLNNESVRVIEYNEQTGKYLIRPSIPIPEAQKLATTGMLIVSGNNLIASEQEIRVWTFAALYDGKKMTQNVACQFIEKIILIVEGLKSMDDTWTKGGEMSCQDQFGPILQAQMEAFSGSQEENALDATLDYCQQVVQNNLKIVLGQATAACGP